MPVPAVASTMRALLLFTSINVGAGYFTSEGSGGPVDKSSGAFATWQLPLIPKDTGGTGGSAPPDCVVSKLATAAGPASRQRCTARSGTIITPWAAVRPELRLQRSATLQLFFSPSWNPSSMNTAIIFGAALNTTFLYMQLVNSSGGYINSCPAPTAQRVLWPTAPIGTTPANPGISPVNLANVSELGWQPMLPRVDLVLPRALVISDGVIITIPGVPSDGAARAEIFLRLYSALLPLLLPADNSNIPLESWSSIATRSAHDLLHRNGSGVLTPAGRLLRVYYNDFRTTNVELIAQLDVLTATRRWNRSSDIHRQLSAAVHATNWFHNELGSIEDITAEHVITPNDGMIFDSFFLLNHLVKLGELASDGDLWARRLLLSSVDRLIMMGRHFQYVFGIYKPLPLQKSSLPGFTGYIEERSDAYGYLYIMMLAHQLTGNTTFLQEVCTATTVATTSICHILVTPPFALAGEGCARATRGTPPARVLQPVRPSWVLRMGCHGFVDARECDGRTGRCAGVTVIDHAPLESCL